MNSFEKIKSDYRKGQMHIPDIGWLIEQYEMLQKDDEEFNEFMTAYTTLEKRLLDVREQNLELIAELRNLKAKKWYTVYKENLELIDKLKIVTRERDQYKEPFECYKSATPGGR